MNLKMEVTRKQSAPNFPKICAYQGVRNVCFFGKFGAIFFLVTSVLRFALLLYYWRIVLLKIHQKLSILRHYDSKKGIVFKIF